MFCDLAGEGVDVVGADPDVGELAEDGPVSGVGVEQHHVEVGVHHAADGLDDAVHVEGRLDQLLDLLVVHVQRAAADDLEEVRAGQLEARETVFLGEVGQVWALDAQAADLSEGGSELREGFDGVLLAEADGLVLVVRELFLDHFAGEADVRLVLGGELVEQQLFLADEQVHDVFLDHVSARLAVHDDLRGQLDDELVVLFDPA